MGSLHFTDDKTGLLRKTFEGFFFPLSCESHLLWNVVRIPFQAKAWNSDLGICHQPGGGLFPAQPPSFVTPPTLLPGGLPSSPLTWVRCPSSDLTLWLYFAHFSDVFKICLLD